MPNTKATGVAYSDPQFDSVSVTGQIYAGQGVYTPTYTYNTLPSTSSLAVGTQLWTSDNGLVVNNGTSWISVSGNDTPQNALTTVIIGNSITVAQQYGAAAIGDSWQALAEIQLGSALSGSPLKFPRITASTRCDAWGTYGYSGQTSTTILADLQGQVWTPLQTAGIKPDIVIAGALFENDIGLGAGFSTATMIANCTQFIRDVQARYPGVIIVLTTPHPSYSYDTASKVASYQAMVTYLQSLDNGVDIFTATVNTYENTASPGTPLSGFTDASVHPNAKGAMRNARVYATTFRRIIAAVKQSYYAVGTNMALTGTAAASGTNVTGTVPTSVTIGGSANGTFVGLAEQPGFVQTTTANAGVAVDIGTSNIAAYSYTGGANTQLSPFMELEIVSGAENLSFIEFTPRYFGTTGNTLSILFNITSAQTTAAPPELQNGDVLLFRSPPRMLADFSSAGLTGSFTSIQNYVRFVPKDTGGTFAVRIKTNGIGIVVA